MRRNAHVAVYLGMINQSQELVYLNNSQYLKENHTGSHLENEVTVSSKITPSKPIRKSLRQNMVRNINVYNKHVKKHMNLNKYSHDISFIISCA